MDERSEFDGVIFAEDEKILFTARVSGWILIPCILAAVIFIFTGVVFLRLGFANVNNPDVEVNTKTTAFTVGFAGVALFPVMLFYCRSLLRRKYLVTDRKLVIDQGGKIVRSRKTLLIDTVTGVELKNNLLKNIVDACTVCFYSPCDPPRAKTLFLISYTVNAFAFRMIRREDGEKIYELLQERMQQIKRPDVSDQSE